MEKPLHAKDKPIDKVRTSHNLVKKYDLVFIGGGPSTLAFICYLFQKKLIDKIISSCNILIIEKQENFGSGCLGKYGINTNTSAEGFPRLICFSDEGKKDKSAKLALSPTKNPNKRSENEVIKEIKENSHEQMDNNLNILSVNNASRQNSIIEKSIKRRNPLFNEIFLSSSVQSLLAIGDRPAPLGLVGNFLEILGNFIIHHICIKYGKNILMNRTEVKCIKIGMDETFRIYLKENEMNNDSYSQKEIKVKSLVLCTGGKHNIKSRLYDKIVKIKGEENVFISDFVLQDLGYTMMKKRIKEIKEIASDKKLIVTIIGASHSGFSCAWILLNNPSIFRNNIKNGSDYVPKQIPNCQKCKIINNKTINYKISERRYKSNYTSNNTTNDNQFFIQDCLCYGKVKLCNWSTSCTSQNTKDIDINIHILYRDVIRVYYSSHEEAAKDNYIEFDDTSINKHGKIYPFLGIRGDAKELYRKIQKGMERRVKLIKTPTDNIQLDQINNSDLVIWACGYETNNIPFIDSKNNPIEFLADHNGTVEVDKKLNIMYKNKEAIKNLYGIGQGYSTKAPEIINGEKQRADSIHLYNSHIASKLYKSLGPLFDKFILDNQSSNESINSNLNNANKTNITTNINKDALNINALSNLKANLKRKSNDVNTKQKTSGVINIGQNNQDKYNNFKKVNGKLILGGKYIVNDTPLQKIEEINHIENLESFNNKILLADFNNQISISNNIKIQDERIIKERNMKSANYKQSLINPIFLNDHLIGKPKKVLSKLNVESENSFSIKNHIKKE